MDSLLVAYIRMQKETETAWGELQARLHRQFIIDCAKIKSDPAKAGSVESSVYRELIIDRTEAYVRALFNDLIRVERASLNRRLFPRWRKAYFERLSSEMQKRIVLEFWKAVSEQFDLTRAGYEAGRNSDPRRDAGVQDEIDSRLVKLNNTISNTISMTRENIKRDGMRTYWAICLRVLVVILVTVIVAIIGLKVFV